MAAARQRAAKDFTVRLSTGSWDFIMDDPLGLTVHEPGVVHIKRSRETLDRLDTIVHETLHASNPKMSEAEVARIAGDVAAVLWKAGYRRGR